MPPSQRSRQRRIPIQECRHLDRMANPLIPIASDNLLSGSYSRLHGPAGNNLSLFPHEKYTTGWD
jgi:hypothetical protein